MITQLRTFLAAPLLTAIIWLFYVQGMALLPRFHGLSFRDLRLMIVTETQSTNGERWVKLSDPARDVGAIKRFGYAFALCPISRRRKLFGRSRSAPDCDIAS